MGSLRMVHHFLDAEERRRVSLALSVRHETNARLSELRGELWCLIVGVFRKPASRKPHQPQDPAETLMTTATPTSSRAIK